LKIDKLQYPMMTQNGSLKRIGLPPSWSFKMKCLMGGALETRVLRHDPAREASRGKSGPALGGTEYRLMPSACRLIVRQPL